MAVKIKIIKHWAGRGIEIVTSGGATIGDIKQRDIREKNASNTERTNFMTLGTYKNHDIKVTGVDEVM